MPAFAFSQFDHLVKVPGEEAWALYNFATGRIAKLGDQQRKLFAATPYLPDDSPVARQLLEAGFLTNRDEAAAFREGVRAQICNQALGKTPSTLVLTVVATGACNFACPYCFQGRRTGRMPQDVQDALVRFVEARLAAGAYTGLRIKWFGGEPLLVPTVLESLGAQFRALAAAREIPYSASIYTNGYLLDQDMADMLERESVDHVNISLDGVGEAHDATRHLVDGGSTYDRIMTNLRSLRTSLRFIVRVSMTRDNAHCLDALSAELEGISRDTGLAYRLLPAAVRTVPVATERGDATAYLTPDEFARALEHSDIEEDNDDSFLPSWSACPITRLNELYVDERGDLFPSCMPLASYAEHRLGNVIELADGGSEEFWRKTAAHVADTYAFPDDPACHTCNLLIACHGGCAFKRVTGTVQGEHNCPEYLRDPDGYVLERYRKSDLQHRITDS